MSAALPPDSGAWASLAANARRLFDVELDEHARGILAAFVETLLEWAPRTNLVSFRDRRELIDRHLLDSLAPLPLVGCAARIADLGSGAGFPGVPLAACLPNASVLLVEPRARRASFLRAARRATGLRNVEIVEQRGEDCAFDVDAVVARAVRASAVFAFAERVLRPQGLLVTMQKQGAPETTSSFRSVRRLAYMLPDGTRHEVVAARRFT